MASAAFACPSPPKFDAGAAPVHMSTLPLQHGTAQNALLVPSCIGGTRALCSGPRRGRRRPGIAAQRSSSIDGRDLGPDAPLSGWRPLGHCCRRGGPPPTHAAAGTAFTSFQGPAATISTFLANASPPLYLVYMIAAGLGLPCSEDALVVWAGAGMTTGRYGGWPGILQVAAILYFGVVASDMVTFWLGAALRRGLFTSLKDRLFKDPAVVERAEAVVRRRSQAIGLVQRFSLGFRGPLCLVAGFTGVSSPRFAAGVAIGAVGTMALQITAGYMLRGSPNAYLAALALVAGPNLAGHLAGPVLTALGLWTASRAPPKQIDLTTSQGVGAGSLRGSNSERCGGGPCPEGSTGAGGIPPAV